VDFRFVWMKWGEVSWEIGLWIDFVIDFVIGFLSIFINDCLINC
jgi:hypothetical protein